MRSKNLGELYDLPLVDWSAITDRLDAGLGLAPNTGRPNRDSCWLVTTNADGSPHLTGIGALWHDGSFWFETGEESRKGRNVARDPRCALSVTTDAFDLVVEGDAHKVTDPAVVARLAELWAAGGWPCTVDDSGIALTAPFSAPTAGKPPWSVYKVTIRSAHAITLGEGSGATRWDFE